MEVLNTWNSARESLAHRQDSQSLRSFVIDGLWSLGQTFCQMEDTHDLVDEDQEPRCDLLLCGRPMQSGEAKFAMAVIVCPAQKIHENVPMELWLLSWVLSKTAPSAGDSKVALQ